MIHGVVRVAHHPGGALWILAVLAVLAAVLIIGDAIARGRQ